MTSLNPENWAHNNETFEELQHSALLTSLLDESLADQDCDDERLTVVIRSLEAEINPTMIDGHDSTPMPKSGVEGSDGQDGSISHDHGGLLDCWMDMDLLASSPSDEMSNLYMVSCEDEMEFEGLIRDYTQNCYGFSIMEEQGYGSLWQESNA